MLNFIEAGRSIPKSSLPGSDASPFQWMPNAVSFVRRQIRFIIRCGVAGLVLGVIYLALATPQYTAIATLSIDPGRAHPVGGQDAATDWQSQSAYVESQVVLIQSPATLRGVVTQLQLDQNPLFASSSHGLIRQISAWIKNLLPGALGTSSAGLDTSLRAQEMAGTTLSHMLEVWRVGATSVVEVRVRTSNRALSAQLANAVTEAYMAQQLVAISDTTKRAGGWLESRIGELRGQAVSADKAVQEYKARNNIVDVATGSGVSQMNEQQLGELNLQVASARSRVAASQSRYEQALANTVNGVTQGMVTDMQPNPVMAGLQQQYLDATRHEADLVARMGPTHGAVLLQHKAVVELGRSIQAELGRQTETYRADFKAAEANLQGIQARLTEQVAAAAQTNIERSELRSLQSSADTYRQIYENFLRRFTQAMQDQSYPISDARVAAPALAPMDRSSPKASIALAIAAIFGLALGVVIGLVRESLDVTVRTVAQLIQATGLKYLGAMPQTAAMVLKPNWRSACRSSVLHGEMLVPTAFRQAASDPACDLAGTVHGVRVAAAEHSAGGRDVRVIGCVSISAEEGASTFAANLAFALAADGQRTALIDCNTKMPLLTQILSTGQHSGVQELASCGATIADVTLNDKETGLRFVGQSTGYSPRVQPAPAKIREMLATLRDQNDYIVLDLPPMKDSATATMFSEIADGFVLIARSGSTPQPLLTETLMRASSLNGLFLGTVLTQCDPLSMRPNPGDSTGTQHTSAAATGQAGRLSPDDPTHRADTRPISLAAARVRSL